MTALALFEAKKILRNPLMWLGAALVGAFAWMNAREYWPLVTDDAGFAYQAVVVLAAFALLAGAWVGLRDRVSGAEAMLASTPLRQRGLLVPARMAALAGSGFGVYLLVVAVTATVSWARGGHGAPDAYLALDGALYVALAACTGFAIGYLTGSRIMSLLAAPLVPGAVFYLQGEMSGRVTDPRWVLPNPPLPERFGPLGYLPDILPMHAAYLGAALVALCGIVCLVTARRERTHGVRIAGAAAVAGVAAFLVLGGWLAVQPSQVQVLGNVASDWVEITSLDDQQDVSRAARAAGPYPDDGSASDCADDEGITVCVFPEYGTELAAKLARDASALVPLTGLPGVRDRFRMVPQSIYWGDSGGCADDQHFLFGTQRWNDDYWRYDSLSRHAMFCVLFGPRMLSNHPADVVVTWFDVRLLFERTGDEYDRAVRRRGLGDRASAVLRRMGRLSVDEVVERLRPVWGELRSKDLTLDELTEAMS